MFLAGSSRPVPWVVSCFLFNGWFPFAPLKVELLAGDQIGQPRID